jgi:hypothetical protein
MFFDLTQPETVEVEVWSLELRGNIISGDTWRELLNEITLYTGRMLPPPEWTQLVCFYSLTSLCVDLSLSLSLSLC